MTGDPKRWLSDASAEGSIERELLASVRDVAPPAHAKGEAWRAIAATVAAGSVVAGTSSAASAAATVKSGGAVLAGSLATKVMWTVAAGSIAASSYYYAVRSAAPEEKRAPAAQVATPAPVVHAKPIALEATPEEPAPSVERAAPEPQARRAAPRVAKRRDPLTEESALLTRARAAVRAGDTAAAERMLQRITAEFPGGVLEQERQVLEIELLAARGKLAEAQARARRFAEAYPSSPHTARLRSLLDTR